MIAQPIQSRNNKAELEAKSTLATDLVEARKAKAALLYQVELLRTQLADARAEAEDSCFACKGSV